jgi:hypothetical protein
MGKFPIALRSAKATRAKKSVRIGLSLARCKGLKPSVVVARDVTKEQGSITVCHGCVQMRAEMSVETNCNLDNECFLDCDSR